MEREKNTLNELMDRQPFRVPEGYFEGFTDKIMSRLPEKPEPESEKISIYTRVKPFLYLAAMFVGAMIMINIIGKKKAGSPEDDNGTPVTSGLVSSVTDPVVGISEDAEFLEYIEEMYVDKYALSYIDDFMNNW